MRTSIDIAIRLIGLSAQRDYLASTDKRHASTAAAKFS